jgi:small redox-active disulfide protein 2
MTTIQVLGIKSRKCGQVAANAEKAARELGIKYVLEKVTNLRKIMSYGMLASPGLAIDGAVKTSGRVPTTAEIKEILKTLTHF